MPYLAKNMPMKFIFMRKFHWNRSFSVLFSWKSTKMMAQAFVMYLHSSTTAFQSQRLDFCKSPRWYEKVDVLPVRMAFWKSDICTLTECRLQICYFQEAFCNVFCCREEYFFTLFCRNNVPIKNTYLLPRDMGLLCNDLNYKGLKANSSAVRRAMNRHDDERTKCSWLQVNGYRLMSLRSLS